MLEYIKAQIDISASHAHSDDQQFREAFMMILGACDDQVTKDLMREIKAHIYKINNYPETCYVN